MKNKKLDPYGSIFIKPLLGTILLLSLCNCTRYVHIGYKEFGTTYEPVDFKESVIVAVLPFEDKTGLNAAFVGRQGEVWQVHDNLFLQKPKAEVAADIFIEHLRARRIKVVDLTRDHVLYSETSTDELVKLAGSTGADTAIVCSIEQLWSTMRQKFFFLTVNGYTKLRFTIIDFKTGAVLWEDTISEIKSQGGQFSTPDRLAVKLEESLNTAMLEFLTKAEVIDILRRK